MASDALNPPPPPDTTNGTNGEHAPPPTYTSPSAPDTSTPQPPDAGTLFYQLSAITLLAATWAALIRKDRNAEADRVETIGRGTYGPEAFQAEMNLAVENA